jgi:hypothetical protein
MTVIYLSEPFEMATWAQLAHDMDHSVARHSQADSGLLTNLSRRLKGLLSDCSGIRLDLRPFLPGSVFLYGLHGGRLISGLRR